MNNIMGDLASYWIIPHAGNKFGTIVVFLILRLQ